MEENRIANVTETAGKPAVWKNAPFFLKASLLFSAFYVFCLYDNPSGITYPLFTAGLLGLYVIFLKRENGKLKKSSVFYMTAIFLLGLSNCLTDNGMILWFNKLGSFLLYGILFVHNSCEDGTWRFLKYTGSLLQFGLSVVENLPAAFLAGKDLMAEKRKNPAQTGQKKQEPKAVYVVLGLLIGLLFLFFILPLLASADQRFEQLIDQIFDAVFFQIALPEHLIAVLFMFFWGVLFYFGILSALRKTKISADQKELRKLEPVMAATFLCVIGVVYQIFCLVQISYLFAGGLRLPSGYTYSGFAREGFFQLLFVSILNLGVVLFVLELFRSSKVLKILLTFLCGCTYIMALSSACRMYLYIEAYGLTRLRVLVLAALLMIALMLGGMICCVYRESFPLFRFSAAVVTSVYVVLSLGHMDAWIAEYNISQKGIDIGYRDAYTLTLSADTAGVLERAARKGMDMTVGAEEVLQDYFSRLEDYEDQGIRRFNLSRYLGARAAERYREKADRVEMSEKNSSGDKEPGLYYNVCESAKMLVENKLLL